jgi:hypothetical protein
VIVDDDVAVVADAELAHQRGERFRRGKLSRDRIVRVDDVLRPVHVDRAGDMRRVILVSRAGVLRRLLAALAERRLHVAAHIDDPQPWLAQVRGEPFGVNQ